MTAQRMNAAEKVSPPGMVSLPELLAPAGGMEQLKAAARFGADAVYGGMERYGLRAFAGNFSRESIREAVGYLHAGSKKFYVTMNAFPFDSELEGFIDAARFLRDAGVDGVIVSDLGAACLIREAAPGLAMHISTQANTLNVPAARAWRGLGAARVILAREMSLEQMAYLIKNAPEGLELEAFVHGAACMAYSGRCLLSSALTGRGANQGACAQPCRWKYAVMEEKRPGEYLPVSQDERGTYIFSAQDLNLMPLLPQLAAVGLHSLKIEGRMKSAYYVATVVAAYRRGLDVLKAGGEAAFFAALPELMGELKKASHRESNTGFALGSPQPPGGAEGFYQTMEFAGQVVSDAAPGQEAEVILKNRFYLGDSLEVLTPGGVFPYRPEKMRLTDTGEEVATHGVAGTRLNMSFPFAVGAGDILRGPVRNHRGE